jgi:Flp pilus assembly protein TadB
VESSSLLLLAGLAAAAAGISVALLLLPSDELRHGQVMANGRPARVWSEALVRARRVSRSIRSAISNWRTTLPQLVVGVLVGAVAYALLGLPLPAVVVGFLAWAALQSLDRWREANRRSHQSEALVSAVDLLGQLLPAGHGVRQSLLVLAESGPLELREELTTVVHRLSETSLDQALLESQQRLRQPLYTLIATALTVGSRSGGRLTPLIEELARAAHQVASAQGQLRAEQAQGRFGALVIAMMPLGLVATLRVVNPNYLAPYHTTTGQLIFTGLLAVIALGYLWMLRILHIPDPDVLPLSEATVPTRDASDLNAGELVSGGEPGLRWGSE